MTLVEAITHVRDKPMTYTIFRMPGWPANFWSVTLKTPRELPDNAEVYDQAPAPATQGGLF